MAKKSLKSKREIKRIKNIYQKVKNIRSANNIVWMALVELATEENPAKAKKLLHQIVKNDKRISRWMGHI